MIIKSHIRGGYRSAAAYLKAQGQNEYIRTVEISDPDAKTLDQAFNNMWEIARNSKVKKLLHHISINPMKDETLTDEQVLKIVERCEQKYGYAPNDHQRVIVEHIKDGRQHFHVMWNRVSLTTGKVVKSGEHWKKSKQAAREMEKELALKHPTPRRHRHGLSAPMTGGRSIGGGNSSRLHNITSLTGLNGSTRPISGKNGGGRPAQPSRPRHRIGLHPQSQTLRFTASLSASSSSPAVPVQAKPQTARPQTQVQHRPQPQQPTSGRPPSMSEAQWLDFLAACEGKISWRQYFQKWGKSAAQYDGHGVG